MTEALEELLNVHTWRASSLPSQQSRAGQIVRLLGEIDLQDLCRTDLEGYISRRQSEAISDHTIFKELVLIRLALKLAREQGRWSGDIEVLFPRHRADYHPRERWLSPEEAGLLLEHITRPEKRFQRTRQRKHRWVMLALYVGGRKSEVGSLAWQDIDFPGRLVRVRGTKTDRADRTLPLAHELEAYLLPQRPAESERLDVPIAGHWDHADKGLKDAAARAGIPPVTPTDLRRTCASWMALAGVPPLKISTWLGHSSLDMVTRVYARLNPEGLREAADALPSVGVAPVSAWEPRTKRRARAGRVVQLIPQRGAPK